MFDGDTVDRTIRNHEYRAWPSFAVIVAFAVCWMVVLNLGEVGVSPRLGFALLFVTGALFGCFMVASAALGLYNPIWQIKLGEELSVRPGGRRYTPIEIRRIARFADPNEDFRESDLPIRLCVVEIDVRLRRPLRLLVTVGEAERIRQWAETKGIRVVNESTDPNIRRDK